MKGKILMIQKIKLLMILSLIYSINSIAQPPSPAEILKRIDNHLLTTSSIAKIKMAIHLSRNVVRHKLFKSYSKGRDRSFLEFIEPARDKGTKFLRIKKSMWIYFPRAKKSVLIKGHMLRRGMMGSDFSYEDLSETSSLLNDYNAKVIDSEIIEGKETFVLELIAKAKSISYPKRKIWVDKKTYIPIRNEFYALSGKLLKTFLMSDIKKFGKRWFPTKWTMKDELRKNTKTVMNLVEVQFDVPIADELFTKRYLEK